MMMHPNATEAYIGCSPYFVTKPSQSATISVTIACGAIRT